MTYLITQVVVGVDSSLHGHGLGKVPEISAALTGLGERLGQHLCSLGEVSVDEDLLQDVSSQFQSRVVSLDSVGKHRVVRPLAAVVPVLEAHVMVVETSVAASAPIAELETAMEAESQHLGSVGQRLRLRPGGEAELRVDFEKFLHHATSPVEQLRQLGLDDESLLRGPGLAGGGEEEGGQEAGQQQ